MIMMKDVAALPENPYAPFTADEFTDLQHYVTAYGKDYDDMGALLDDWWDQRSAATLPPLPDTATPIWRAVFHGGCALAGRRRPAGCCATRLLQRSRAGASAGVVELILTVYRARRNAADYQRSITKSLFS